MQLNKIYIVLKSVPTASGRLGHVKLCVGDQVRVVKVMRDGNVDVRDMSNNRIIKKVSPDYFMDTHIPSFTKSKQ